MREHVEILGFDRSEFDAFAELSGDRNPIHVDPGFAAGTRFGRPVAHGMMLFAATSAGLARALRGPTRLVLQDLRFPAPTFAGEELELRIAVDDASRTATETLVSAARGPTLEGAVVLAGGPLPEPHHPPDGDSAAAIGSLRVGARAELVRRFRPEDTAALLDLVRDRNPIHRGPDATLPPALLGGLVSTLLGMHLPGPGANWLKQRYRFPRPVALDAEVTAVVEVVRLRPEKALVDLAVSAVAGGVEVLSGRSLVLVRDAPAAH